MIFPALIFALFNYNNPEHIHGWGIPMATDIAFTLGIIALLGNRVDVRLKVFLTALAIADDLGSTDLLVDPARQVQPAALVEGQVLADLAVAGPARVEHRERRAPRSAARLREELAAPGAARVAGAHHQVQGVVGPADERGRLPRWRQSVPCPAHATG